MTNQLHHAQQKLKPLEWIIGQWHGQGQAQGSPIYGVLHATLRLENSFLVILEAFWTPTSNSSMKTVHGVSGNPHSNT